MILSPTYTNLVLNCLIYVHFLLKLTGCCYVCMHVLRTKTSLVSLKWTLAVVAVGRTRPLVVVVHPQQLDSGPW